MHGSINDYPWPLFIIAGLVVISAVVTLVHWHLFKRRNKITPTQFPAHVVEKICRAMCAADGRDPDGGGMRMIETDSYDACNHAWELYEPQARRFLAAQLILADDPMLLVRLKHQASHAAP